MGVVITIPSCPVERRVLVVDLAIKLGLGYVEAASMIFSHLAWWLRNTGKLRKLRRD